MPKTSVLIAGRFNVLHPGHIRLFRFAHGFGDRLLVAVESDNLAGESAHVRQELRLESVKSCILVNEAFVFDEPISDLIERLQPEVIVKGKEYEEKFNPEAEAVASYGGKLIFSSGELQFSSVDLLRREFLEPSSPNLSLPLTFMSRHDISPNRLWTLISSFCKLRVLTLGDLIIDDYIDCKPLGMSQEDPTLVVSPIVTSRFIGGAGIVAAHARGLGATSNLISIVGRDSGGEFSGKELRKANVNITLIEDSTRPTTVKERYRCHGKTLLRVSHLHQSAISVELQARIIDRVSELIESIDLLIFSDFNYGVLPQPIVDSIINLAQQRGVLVVADSQSSSQLGDIGRFRDVDLLLPTEREARVSLRNWEDGLVVIAEQLRKNSRAKAILLKMGEDGVLIHAPSQAPNGWLTDQVEALNKFPKDVAGAGDSMLVASGLTLAGGGSLWEAACIGSMAAAVQVAKIGNKKISLDELGLLFKTGSETNPAVSSFKCNG